MLAAIVLGSAGVSAGVILAATTFGSMAVSTVGSMPDMRTDDMAARKALALAARQRRLASIAELDRQILAEQPPTPQNLADNDARSVPTPALAASSVVAANDKPTPAIIPPAPVQTAMLMPAAKPAELQVATAEPAIAPQADAAKPESPAPPSVPLPPRRDVAEAQDIPVPPVHAPPIHAAVLTDTGSRHGSTRALARGEDQRSVTEKELASLDTPQHDDRGLIPRLFDSLRRPSAESVLAYASPDDTPAPVSKPSWMPSLGNRTAYYDISAHTVYLPNGERLEAHSGLGDSFDDPRSANRKNRGATPPNVYELSLRRQLFHGVRALRLTPVGEGRMYGRDGILAHSYMLGPKGASNGCVSFRQYPRFLQAFMNGEVSHLVVVPHMNGG